MTFTFSKQGNSYICLLIYEKFALKFHNTFDKNCDVSLRDKFM